MDSFIKHTQLILNPDGSIYHLKLRPEDISDTIILVGDPQRVKTISAFFDRITLKQENREIVTHTGFYNNKHLTVMSTGMGPDNIDIVLNELDALVNVDLKERKIKEDKTALNIIRLGTSGTFQEDIDVDTFGIGEYALGMDGVLHFYKQDEVINQQEMVKSFAAHVAWPEPLPYPYIVKSDPTLFNLLKEGMSTGITITAPGFYGPQGRQIRMKSAYPHIFEKLASFRYNDSRIINFEMESSALYGLGKLMGHNVVTVCAIIANRKREIYTKEPAKTIEKLTLTLLNRLSA